MRMRAMIERLAERVGASVQTCDGVGEGSSPEAKLMRGMIDLFAEYERQVIKARIRTALGHKKAKQERTEKAAARAAKVHARKASAKKAAKKKR